MKVTSLSCVRLFATPWTVPCQAPPSMGFSRQEYWSGLPFPSPGDLPDPGIEPRSPALQADPLPSEPLGLLYLFIYKRWIVNLVLFDFHQLKKKHNWQHLITHFLLIHIYLCIWWASLVAQWIKNQPARWGGLDPWVRKIPWRRKWQPTPVFSPEISHGQRSLTGYSPQGCKELDTTEQLSKCVYDGGKQL